MRLALAQLAGRPGDVAANLATVARVAGEAARAGAGLVVFPEAFVAGYNIGADRVAALAEPADGPTVAALRETAARERVGVLCGWCERDGDAVFNAALLAGPDGSVLANARKTHLFGPVDRAAFAPGDAFTLARLGDVRIGILVCFDIEFPEPARRLALAGAELIAVPTSLMAPAHLVAEFLVPARAVENQCFVAYANRVGSEGDLRYVGSSCLAGPGGVVARAGAGEELLLADMDVGAVERARAEFSYLEGRRPALY